MSDKPYSNEGKLTLFPNDKGGNEKRPDLRGTFTLNGTDYKVSLWRRTSQQGREYISGPIEIAQPKPSGPPQSAYEQPKPVERQPGLAYRASAEPGMRTEGKAEEDVPF